jgi:hypothetical protein
MASLQQRQMSKLSFKYEDDGKVLFPSASLISSFIVLDISTSNLLCLFQAVWQHDQRSW